MKPENVEVGLPLALVVAIRAEVGATGMEAFLVETANLELQRRRLLSPMKKTAGALAAEVQDGSVPVSLAIRHF